MSVRLDGNVIYLEGLCRIEEVEALFDLLQQGQGRKVDISRCLSLHTALVQILLAIRPVISGDSTDSFICNRLVPAIVKHADGSYE